MQVIDLGDFFDFALKPLTLAITTINNFILE